MSLEQTTQNPDNPKPFGHSAESAFREILERQVSTEQVIKLDHLNLIRVTGDDAESFLQSQFSNDLSKLVNNQCQLHAYCNPKGRTLAILNIMRSGPGFWIVVPQEITELFVNRLKIFILRAKVNLEVDNNNLIVGTMSNDGPQSREKPIYTMASAIVRQLIIAEPQTISEVTSASQKVLDGRFWRLADILSGIPQVYAQTVEAFIPQQINLDLVGGISFKKGCYPGQEIIARIKYLGKSKQRMIIAKAESALPIKPGDSIYSVNKPDQKPGMIVDAVQIDAQQHYLTAMVSVSVINTGELRIGTASGPKLTRLPLPYDLDQNE